MTDNEWDEYAGGWDTNRSTTVYANCAFAELLKITELAALSVFDFGCGTGLLSERMSPEVSHIVALDSSAKMIERLKQKALPNVFPIAEFLTGDLIRRNSLMHQKFDLITASSVCAFLPDYKADLSLLRSILKPKPTIAAIAAPARAAGMTLAISCDMVIAADDVDLSYPEVAVGVIPAMHFVHLPRQIGRHKAFELLFTGDTITAPEAERRGLVNYAVTRASPRQSARVWRQVRRHVARGHPIGPQCVHAGQRFRIPPRYRKHSGYHLQHHFDRRFPRRPQRLQREAFAKLVICV